MRESTPQDNLNMDITPNEYQRARMRYLGNYHIYAKLDDKDKWNDCRLKYLKAHYFHKKVVLDVGCNEGILTIPIARKFQPQLIKGIDIDPQLIKKTRENKEKFARKNRKTHTPKEIITEIRELPKYFKESIVGEFKHVVAELDEMYEVAAEKLDFPLFPHNIELEVRNILAENPTIGEYQTILCMNVTKWIHLAYGDAGIKLLFKRLSSMLQEGGLLILEAQKWNTYRKKRNLFPFYNQNYRMILNKPDKFAEMLKKMGFTLLEELKAYPETELKHDILVFQKQDTSGP